MPAHQPNIFYDISEGAFLLGEIARDAHIDAGAHPEDIKEFVDLLTSEERQVAASDFPKIPWEEWEYTDIVPHLRFLQNVISESINSNVISEEIITRAGYLGLSPRISFFKMQRGGLSRLYQSADIATARTREAFDDWSVEDYINYARRLEKKLKRKPEYEDFLALSESARNPSPKIIAERFGSIGVILEPLGYPNIKGWSEDDFIEWGVKFMKANDGKLPTSRALAILSRKKRGPNVTTIYDRPYFTSLMDYQTRVARVYETQAAEETRVQKLKIEAAQLAADHDFRLKRILDQAQTETDIIGLYAKYRVAATLLTRDASSDDLFKTCTPRDPSYFVKNILQRSPHINTAHIEETANTLGVFEDIWPFDDYMTFLKVG